MGGEMVSENKSVGCRVVGASKEVIGGLMEEARELKVSCNPEGDFSGQTSDPVSGLLHVGRCLINNVVLLSNEGDSVDKARYIAAIDLSLGDIFATDPARLTEKDICHPTEKIVFKWRKVMLERLSKIFEEVNGVDRSV
jgi:hypothetical protein